MFGAWAAVTCRDTQSGASAHAPAAHRDGPGPAGQDLPAPVPILASVNSQSRKSSPGYWLAGYATTNAPSSSMRNVQP